MDLWEKLGLLQRMQSRYAWITAHILGYMLCSRHHGTQVFCIMAYIRLPF